MTIGTCCYKHYLKPPLPSPVFSLLGSTVLSRWRFLSRKAMPLARTPVSSLSHCAQGLLGLPDTAASRNHRAYKMCDYPGYSRDCFSWSEQPVIQRFFSMSILWSPATLEQGLSLALWAVSPLIYYILSFPPHCPMLLPLFRMSDFFLFFQVVASLQQKARMQEPAQPTAAELHFLIL